VKYPEYRQFLEHFDQNDIGDLQSFAERVVRFSMLPSGVGDYHCIVFMMASPRDESLESEIRRILTELDILVFPLSRSARVLEEGSTYLEVVRRCDAILLINGKDRGPFLDRRQGGRYQVPPPAKAWPPFPLRHHRRPA
jgi:hypothetical protein